MSGALGDAEADLTTNPYTSLWLHLATVAVRFS
jgi:hypothetical protein